MKMGNIGDFLAGTKVLEETESKHNGKISVTKSIAFGTYIRVGGLTQSGGIVTKIWDKVLARVNSGWSLVDGKSIRVLVLGLGGGGLVSVIKKYWPQAKITGVDIDPVMVALGKKYLRLNVNELEIEIGDAMRIAQSKLKSKKKYSMVLVDLYVGDSYPSKFENPNFLKLVLNLLTDGGIAVFNRLYYGEKRSQAVKFGNTLEKIFSKVEVVYPEANVMFVCLKQVT